MSTVVKLKPNRISHSAASKAYRFKDTLRDPVMLEAISLLEADPRSIIEIAHASRLSPQTLYNMIHGKTRKPQNATLDFLFRELGYRRELRNVETGGIRELPIWNALFELKAHVDKIRRRVKRMGKKPKRR